MLAIAVAAARAVLVISRPARFADEARNIHPAMMPEDGGTTEPRRIFEERVVSRAAEIDTFLKSGKVTGWGRLRRATPDTRDRDGIAGRADVVAN